MTALNIVLASGSPRRREILAWTGWTFQVIPIDFDETPHMEEPPAHYTLRLAEGKARAVSATITADSTNRDHSIIIAADTIVAYGSTLLGKPGSSAEAATMLKFLRGRVHQVHTALAVLSPFAGGMLTDICTSQVPMRDYSDAEIEAYIASNDPFDKAGAYAIQHPGFHPVENLHDCYACVMGLPLCHLARIMAKLGIFPMVSVSQVCQQNIGYTCQVFPEILGAINNLADRQST